MKERCIFEEKDFESCGQMIIRQSSPKNDKDINFAVTVSYKVGYIFIDGEQKPALIALSDGLILVYEDIKRLCETLNTDERGYRPMSSDEIKNILGGQGNRFNL